MTGKRTYDDGCAAARALNLVGERWALLVVRELVLGPKRFTDLRAGLPGISPNVLTQRLDELERSAVVRRRRVPPPFAAWVYELTAWGEELGPILTALGRWGARSPAPADHAPIGTDSLVLSLRAMFDAAAAEGLDARYELRLGEHVFRAAVGQGRFHVERGTLQQPDAVIEADADTLAAVVYGGQALPAAVRDGRVRIQGDKAAAKRFLQCFTLPPPAAT